MKVTAPTSLSNVNSVDDLKKYTGIFAAQIAQILNANITFVDNMFVTFATYSFVNVNRTVGIAHGLNSIPVGYFLVGSDSPMRIYDGNQKNTITTLYLQSDATGNARIMVFG